jgi:hypothetical protein
MWKVAPVVLLLAGCKTKYVDPTPTPTTQDQTTDTHPNAPDVKFVPHVIDTLPSPQWAAVGDLDGDGSPEIVVSALGEVTQQAVPPGQVVAYSMKSGLDDWKVTDLVTVSAGVEYPNQPTLADVDGDGKTDVIVPSGGNWCAPSGNPCGSIRWLKNNGGGSYTPHVLVDDAPFFYTGVALGDLDGDGKDDLVACSELDATFATSVQVFKGLGGGQFSATPGLIGDHGGAFPVLEDVDGDGDLDVMTGETFDTGRTFTWFQNQNGAWIDHPILVGYGPGWQIGFVDDLYGDGKLRAVATNHTNTSRPNDPDPWDSVAVALKVPGDPTSGTWDEDVISDGIVALPDTIAFPHPAPGAWSVGDADGDGDLDVAVAGGGDPNVYLLDQTEPGVFTTRVLAAALGQTAGTAMVDLDGDGDQEIVVVAGRENGVYVVSRE